MSRGNAKLLRTPVELPNRPLRRPLSSLFGIVIARNVAKAQKHVREAVLLIHEQMVPRRKTSTHNGIQLIIDIRRISRLAVPCVVASSVLAVCVALLRLILERTIPYSGRQGIWILIHPCEGAACLIGIC